MKKTGIVILARMGSKRFPGKSLAKIAGRELLGIILDRVRYLAPNHECCVATSVMPQDDLIEDFCALENVPCYRGDESRVADRFVAAAKMHGFEYALRMNGDRPLFDDENFITALRFASLGKYDLISNQLDKGASTAPGLTTEVVRVAVLEKFLKDCRHSEDQEHVTTVLYKNLNLINVLSLGEEVTYDAKALSLKGFAVDLPEDAATIESIILKTGKLRTLRMSDVARFREEERTALSDAPFLIAEIGGNHEGDFDYAKLLTNLAIESEAHSVKFQLYTGDTLVNRKVDPDRHKHFIKFELTLAQHEELAKMCIAAGKVYSASVWNEEHLEALDTYLGYYKIGSGDLTNWGLLKKFAERGKPIVLSTGLSYLGEVSQAVRYLRNVNDIYSNKENLAVLQCTSMYPIEYSDANLSVMTSLTESLQSTIGYSDHTVGIDALKSAVAMGAEVLEFHFTDNRDGKDFRDQKCSKTKQEVADLTDFIKKHRSLYGAPLKKPLSVEIENGHDRSFRRAAYYSRDLAAGHKVSEEDISYLRPSGSLHPDIASRSVLGRRLAHPVKKYDPLAKKDVEKPSTEIR